MSGVKALYFIPKDDVVTINAKPSEMITNFDEAVVVGSSAMEGKAIEASVNKGFAKIFIGRDLGELKYIPQGSMLGNRSFKATLEIFKPVFETKMLGFLATMINQELILVVLLNNGEYHLIGDIDRGAIISEGVEATSGKAPADNNGATIPFEWDAPRPQIFYEGWTPADPQHGITMIEDAAK